jgi:hypothetical protein
MVENYMLDAEKALIDALSDYEGNGVRYEPSDREELQNLILQVEKLRQRLAFYMANLPNLDHHTFGKKTVTMEQPRGVGELFEELDRGMFISPDGPLGHSLAYQHLKDLFTNTTLSIAEAYFLLHNVRAN